MKKEYWEKRLIRFKTWEKAIPIINTDENSLLWDIRNRLILGEINECREMIKLEAISNHGGKS